MNLKPIALPLLIAVLCLPAHSQERKPSGKNDHDELTIRVDTTLVNVPVAVLTREGKFISNLRRENFRILEDGVEQEITHFKNIQEPFTVALLLDISDSAKINFQEIKDAATAFIDQLRPQDRAMIVVFDAHVTVMSEATDDKDQLRAAINRTVSGGGTSIYDAVEQTFHQQLSKIQGRKAIVMFTDGVDQHSRQATRESTLELAEEQDAAVYVIRYDTYEEGIRIQMPGGRNMSGTIVREGPGRKDHERAQQYLHSLSEVSGGRYYFADKTENLKRSFAKIVEELSHQYVLGYYPGNLNTSQKRRGIKVKVDVPNAGIRSRKNYIYKASTDKTVKP